MKSICFQVLNDINNIKIWLSLILGKLLLIFNATSKINPSSPSLKVFQKLISYELLWMSVKKLLYKFPILIMGKQVFNVQGLKSDPTLRREQYLEHIKQME